jgi:Mg-chelatase subunit ChlD
VNPELPPEQLAEYEARLTAYLLGELPAHKAAALRQELEENAELAKLYDRLKPAIKLVEAASRAAQAEAAPAAPLKLSADRREKLLAQFKTIAPKEFAEPSAPQKINWMLLAACAVIFIALSGLFLPALAKSKSKAMRINALSNLRELDMAKEMWAGDNKKGAEDAPTFKDLKPYLPGAKLPPVAGERYLIGKVGESASAEVDRREAKKLLGVNLPSSADASGSVRIYANGATVPVGEMQLVQTKTPQEMDRLQPQSQGLKSERNPFISRYATLLQQQHNFANSGEETTSSQAGLPAAVSVQPSGSPTTTGKSEIVLPAAEPAPVAAPALVENEKNAFGNTASITQGFKAQDSAANPLSNRAMTLLQQQQNTGLFGKFRDSSPGSAASASETFRPFGSSTTDGKSQIVLPAEEPAPGIAPALVQNEKTAFGLPAPAMPMGGFGAVNENLNAITPPVQLAETISKSQDKFQAGVSGSIQGFGGGSKADGFDFKTANLDSVSVAESPALPMLGSLYRSRAGGGGGGSSNEYNLGIVGYVNVPTSNAGAAKDVQPGARPAARNPSFGEIGGSGNASDFENTSPPGSTRASTPILAPTAQNNPPVYRNRELNQTTNAVSTTVAAGSLPNEATLSYDPETHSVVVMGDDSTRNWINRAMQSQSGNTLSDSQNGPALIKGNSNSQLLASDTPVTSARAIENLQKESDAINQGDLPLRRAPKVVLPPTPEILTRENAFSTFSLNVADVSFKLAEASLAKGVMPDAASIRSEEFINAFDYRDPDPAPGAPLGFAWERAHDPFAHNRDLLRFSVKTAAAGRPPGRALNIVLLLDNSGSMERADRVQIIHEALRVLATQLQPQDKLSIVTFARTPRLWVDGVPGDQAGAVFEKVSGLTPQGGTNLEDAMRLAYETARRHYLADGVNRVVLLTDGAANLGNVDATTLRQKVEANRKQGIALDCFGIGWEGYNDDLLEALSRNGDGRYGFLNTPAEAANDFAGQLAGALNIAAADVKVQVEFNPKRVKAYRQIGYAKHQLTKQQFRDNSVDAAEIGAAESGNALYVVETDASGEGAIATVHVRFRVPGTSEYREHAWEVPYNGSGVALDQASPAMRLAASAGEFAEWLANNPYAAEVTPDQLLRYLAGVPQTYGADTRPAKLEEMIREAKSISGK